MIPLGSSCGGHITASSIVKSARRVQALRAITEVRWQRQLYGPPACVPGSGVSDTSTTALTGGLSKLAAGSFGRAQLVRNLARASFTGACLAAPERCGPGAAVTWFVERSAPICHVHAMRCASPWPAAEHAAAAGAWQYSALCCLLFWMCAVCCPLLTTSAKQAAACMLGSFPCPSCPARPASIPR